MKFLDIPKSGSIAAQTFSRNRFGQYARNRSIPVNPNTTNQSTQRNRFTLNTQAYRSLTDAQRAGWASLGAEIVRNDSLGQSYSLTGIQAYCAINNNLLDAGESVVSTAPALTDPTALLTATITSTGGTLSLAYTATPLGTGVRLFVYASPQRSQGRYFEKDLRLIYVTAAAAASPANILSAYTARFGAPVVGNKIFFQLECHLNGFKSTGLLKSHVVVT